MLRSCRRVCGNQSWIQHDTTSTRSSVDSKWVSILLALMTCSCKSHAACESELKLKSLARLHARQKTALHYTGFS